MPGLVAERELTADDWVNIPSVSPRSPFRISSADMRYGADYVRQHLMMFVGTTARRMGRYTFAVLLTAIPFLGECIRHKDTLPIFANTWQLVKKDVLPPFFAAYIYYFLAAQLGPSEDVSSIAVLMTQSILTLVYSALCVFSTTQLLQFYLHNSLILLEHADRLNVLSQLYQNERIKKLSGDKKEQRLRIQNTNKEICLECNKLRVFKGKARNFLEWVLQESLLEGLRRAPYLSAAAYPLESLFVGQLIFNYQLSHYCNSHQRVNLREYWELFLSFGLIYQAVVYITTWSLALLRQLPNDIFHQYAAPTFFITPALETLSALPSFVSDAHVRGFVLLYLAGLACYLSPLPLVKTSSRYCPDFGTHWVADILLNFFIFQSKKIVKKAPVRSASDVECNEEDLTNQRFLSFANFKVIATDIGGAIGGVVGPVVKAISAYNPFVTRYETEADLPKMAVFLDVIVGHIETARHIHKGLADQFLSNALLRSIVGGIVVPKTFHSLYNVIDDPIFQKNLPQLLKNCRDKTDSILFCRKTMIDFAAWVNSIDHFFSYRGVKIVSRIVGLGVVTDMFSISFIVNSSVDYAQDLLGVLRGLRRWKIISNKMYQARQIQIKQFQQKILVVRQVLNELPESLRDDFIEFLRSDVCIVRLNSVMKILFELLMVHPAGSALLKFDEVSHKDAAAENAADCDDPEDAADGEEDSYVLVDNSRVEESAANYNFSKDAATEEEHGFILVDSSQFKLQFPPNCVVQFEGSKVVIQLSSAAAPARTKSDDEFEEVPAPNSADFRKRFGVAAAAQSSGSSASFVRQLVGSAHRLSANLAGAAAAVVVGTPKTQPSFVAK